MAKKGKSCGMSFGSKEKKRKYEAYKHIHKLGKNSKNKGKKK